MSTSPPLYKKAVVVEDDEAIQYMYKLKLEKANFKVKTASNGQEGLSVIEELRPDIILLDLNMPVMSGDKMLEAVRARPWGNSIKVIVLTNISKDEAPPVLRILNVDRYIVKAHYTPNQVLEIVNEILGENTRTSSLHKS